MQIINKKNYLSIVCAVYTVISIGKIILEAVIDHKDPYYEANFITIFLLSLVATLVLSIHYYLQNLPLIIIFLGQYIFLIGIIMISLWIESHFHEMASTAYRDMFISFTIPYLIFAIMYYVTYFLQLKNANKTLEDLKKDGGNKDEH